MAWYICGGAPGASPPKPAWRHQKSVCSRAPPQKGRADDVRIVTEGVHARHRQPDAGRQSLHRTVLRLGTVGRQQATRVTDAQDEFDGIAACLWRCLETDRDPREASGETAPAAQLQRLLQGPGKKGGQPASQVAG